MKRALILLFIMAFFCSSVNAASPDQCLRQISGSIDKGDSVAFEHLIDMDAIMNQAMDIFISEMSKPENGSNVAPMIALLLSQASGQGSQAISNLLKQEARAFVLNGIQSGAFAGRQFSSGGQPKGYLAPLFSSASMGRKEIRNIGQPVEDENGWFMPFNVHDYGNGQDYALIGRFSSAENGPCLVNIENLDQIFYQIKKEAE